MSMIKILLPLTLLLVSTYCIPDESQLADLAAFGNVATGYRLPENVVPQQYDIFIEPTIREQDSFFIGTTKISFKAENGTNKVIFHAKDLNITCIELGTEPDRNKEPDNSTTKPGSSTTKPTDSTTKPDTSTPKPDNSTPKPVNTTNPGGNSNPSGSGGNVNASSSGSQNSGSSGSQTFNDKVNDVYENVKATVHPECKLLPEGFKYFDHDETKDPDRDFIIVTLKENLKAEKLYTLVIHYNATMTDNKKGFYTSSYVDPEGKTKWLASTHFEPVGARLAFPCFDEPAKKAKFTISIKHSKDLVAVSNMPEDNRKEHLDVSKITTIFKTTPMMSTYLVAFAVSDYGIVSNENKTFNVWTKKNATKQAEYALKFGEKVIEKLDLYTGKSYLKMGVPKLDQISIPNLSAGAMENWGLVTYRETALLYEEGVSTAKNLQSIATIIAHEFAHQWFGNLVSPAWWEYVWLNEGFATYFQYYIADILNPDWKLMSQFIVIVQQGTAFVHDAYENSHPMDNKVATPTEISNMFDRIAYEKAGSVIHMMSHFLTEKHFKAGLRRYLSDNAFKSATSAQLLDSFQQIINLNPDDFPKDFNIVPVMKSWFAQSGYPVVTVARDYESGKVTLTQERFYLIKPETPANTKWTIPINYATKKDKFNDTKPLKWFDEKDAKLEITNEEFKGNNWILFNLMQSGYYRVNYDEKTWGLLTKFLDSDSYIDIPPVNRAQLIDDALNLARANYLNYSVALELVTYLSRETDYIAWYPAFTGLSYLDKILATTSEYKIFKAFNAIMILKVMDKLKLDENEKDDHLTKISRTQVAKWACYYELKTCTEHAEKKFNAWLKEPAKNPISPNLRRNIMCTALRTAPERDFNKTVALYPNITNSLEKDDIVSGLGCSKNPVNLWRYLNLTLDKDSKIKDASGILTSVITGSSAGAELALYFIEQNYNKIKSIKEIDLKKLLSEIGQRITTKDQYGTYALFVARNGISEEVSKQATKNALENIIFLEQHGKQIKTWLNKKKYSMPKEKKNSAGTLSFSILFVLLSIVITRFY